MSTPVSDCARPLAAIDEDALYARVTRRFVPFLFVCYVVAYLDRVNVGFAKLTMAVDLGFSDTVYGLGAGIFFLGYFLFEVPSNLLLHRIGARRALARIMISWGLLSSAMMLVESPTSFYALRFLLGVAEAGFFPGVVLYLTWWYPAARRGRVTALFVTAVAVSGVIGNPLSGWIMQSFDGRQGWHGWQWLFLLEGLPAVALGLATLWWLDDRSEDARWLSAAEKRVLAAKLAADDAHKTEMTALAGLRDRRVWLLAAIYFCLVSGLYGVNFWLPTIVKGLGIEEVVTIGIVSALPWAAAALTMTAVGHSADRRRERRYHVAVPALIGAVGLAASVPLAGHPAAAVFALSLGTCGLLSAIPLAWSLATAFLGGAAAASGIALINSFGNLSGFAMPYLIGYLRDSTGSTDLGLYTLAGFLTLGAWLVLTKVPAALTGR
ncbi:MAG TPA: MFS transporter [Gammaproteobacteria bacterium]|nr:MFS transporter [Gammaproteobacteria bacterium]